MKTISRVHKVHGGSKERAVVLVYSEGKYLSSDRRYSAFIHYYCRSWITLKALPDTDLPRAKELIFTVAPCENKDSGRKGENGFYAAK